ncbi:HigA family addiction module antitoxin [Euryhalocaulis caribicus]|uniref:HigA family addiction module antitoxin n=1 Tax=Euryhalocaulis caribicus TaxID=1161401 RepID=UPI0003A9F173|nr:HigA family addiction module antitoxin [Euryhalocaulis caribicus]
MADNIRVPAPPGAILTDEFMPDYGVKAPTLARALGVPRARLQRLLEGAAMTADMALRLARAFGTTPEFWMNLQAAHDIGAARAAGGDADAIQPLQAA